MYDDISFSKDDFNETSYRRMGIRSMYDDIEYSKDDFDIRSIHGREYAVCMTTVCAVNIMFLLQESRENHGGQCR